MPKRFCGGCRWRLPRPPGDLPDLVAVAGRYGIPDKTGNVVYRWLDIARFQMYIRNDVDDLKANYYK